MGVRLAIRNVGCPPGRPPLARGRARRRHDAAREAALEGRSGRDRRTRRAAAGRRRPRLGDEREDDDERDARSDPRHALSAGVEQLRRQSRLGNRLHPPLCHRCGPGPARGRRVRVPRGDATRRPAGRLARQPLPRPARPVRRARAHRRALAAAVAALPHASLLVVNADDPLVADLAEAVRSALRFGLDDPRLARSTLQHAADSKYCVRCGGPYSYAAAYVGHLGDYRCPACGHARPPLDLAARSIDLQALDASAFDLVTPSGTARVRLPLPGLYNVYNALAATATALRSTPRSLEVRPRRPRDDSGRLREPRGPNAPRRRRRPLGRVVAGHGNDGMSGYEGAVSARPSARISTGLCSHATPRWRTGCSAARLPTPAARATSSRCRTSSSVSLMPSPPGALARDRGVTLACCRRRGGARGVAPFASQSLIHELPRRQARVEEVCLGPPTGRRARRERTHGLRGRVPTRTRVSRSSRRVPGPPRDRRHGRDWRLAA